MASSEITFKITGAENLRKRLKANNLLMTPLRNYFNQKNMHQLILEL